MRASLLCCVVAATLLVAANPDTPPTPDPGVVGQNLQRTLRALADSTPAKRNTVRMLFYGQSITEQGWADQVAADLKARFPHANLVIENRALGGYASQLLVKTAETDLYSFYPDLLIFHVYGAHTSYADIIRRVRERTTAEILMQTDHVVRPSDLTEETDPAKLPPRGDHWDAFMNHNWLPMLAKKYEAELCDQRALWKQYLTANKLEPKALLRDNVHLNARGEQLMAECVKKYLRRDARFDPPKSADWIKTLTVGREVSVTENTLTVPFTGNRVDVILAGEPGPAVVARIDDRPPSDFPGVYRFTRATPKPGGKWPVVAGFTPTGAPLVEDWTLNLTRDAANAKRYTFTLVGSQTGADGAGSTDQPFQSTSGRVVLQPEDWNIEFALQLAGVSPPPEKFTASFSTIRTAQDTFTPQMTADPTVETVVTLAQGLPNADHTLTLTGGVGAVKAVRVYRPPVAEESP